MAAPLSENYEKLKEAAKKDLRGDDVTKALLAIIDKGLDLLIDDADRFDLESEVPTKQYFMFKHKTTNKTSRPINKDLFISDRERVVETINKLADRWVPEPKDVEDLNRSLYTATMSYCAGTDITKSNDKKTPGTFFEILVGHLVSRAFAATPTTSVKAPTLDVEISLPTDFIFFLGENKPRIHLPVKTSTRERVVQVWAHQRVLDGMHGVNRFRGLLVALTETNKKKDKSVVEICLPNQWAAYQMYIAQLHRVYYLDVPRKYLELADKYPFLQVRTFAEFFAEREELEKPHLFA